MSPSKFEIAAKPFALATVCTLAASIVCRPLLGEQAVRLLSGAALGMGVVGLTVGLAMGAFGGLLALCPFSYDSPKAMQPDGLAYRGWSKLGGAACLISSALLTLTVLLLRKIVS
ncbi:MAG: hypothetical protein K2Z81_26560 [Cyanobacteria bacterium]|nr:hypothetical protein [Cyanobacteriota bacterium]